MKLRNFSLILLAAISGATESTTGRTKLPDRYFQLMEAEARLIESHLAREPSADLKALEGRSWWRHFPASTLIAAVLYAKEDAANPRFGDPKTLALALRIGDLLAAENERGNFTARQDHHRDTYMWLEAYRLLERELGAQRRTRWRRELQKNVAALAARAALLKDRPAYQSPFIGTSPNHYALWASTVYLAGRVFGEREWEALGASILHRLAAEEQSADGYWGEHAAAGPTAGYDYLTFAGVALYWEHSRDPAALQALRRGTDFHKYFTYPDGHPVELVDDRRRHVYVSPWGHFGFSNFPDGRRYAEFLTSFYREHEISLEHLGRVAQNALYYHQGPAEPIPQDEARYRRQLSVAAGIRKSGPWVVALSGLISTQAAANQYYLDRQGSLSIFHDHLGPVITGANSKRQPELATFREKIDGQVFHLPISSRLRMSDERDRLSLAYNSFFSDLDVFPPSPDRVAFRFRVTPTRRPEEAQLTLQLCLRAGLVLESGGGQRVTLGSERVVLEPRDLGGSIRHNGWTLKIGDPAARLVWPVHPYSPYAAGPETDLQFAVGALTIPLRPATGGTYDISFELAAGERAPATAEQQSDWRARMRTTLVVADPPPPLEPETHGRFEPAAGVVAERLTYGTQFGMRIPAVLYLPASRRGKIPALIVVNGHGGDKYSWYAFYSGILYARAGAAVLTYDPVGEGERNAERKSGTRAHDRIEPPPELARRLAGLMITDLTQAVSYLSERPEIDSSRIGAMGYSLGSFVVGLAGAIERRLRACVLVGGGNLDGPNAYWDNTKPMCTGTPYRSLASLGDRPAVIYALHASRGPTLVFNGLEDVTVQIPRHREPHFRALQRRVAELKGGSDGVFETGFVPGVGHRPFFVTRPVAAWLERQLDFPSWSEDSIRGMEETHIAEWARSHAVELDPLYSSEHREGGTRALGTGVPGLSRTDLSVFSPEEWARQKRRLIYEAWLEAAKARVQR